MRKWCAIAAMGAFFASPIVAQQNFSGSDNSANAVNVTDNATESTNAVDIAAVSHNLFAVPAAALPKPQPSLGGMMNDDHDYGLLVPRFEIAAMYQYINFRPGTPFSDFNNHGGKGEFTFNATKWLGLTAELGGTTFSRDITTVDNTGAFTTTHVDGGLTSFLFGPRLNYRTRHFVPFAEFLVGGVHTGGALTGGGSQYAFGLAAGGGVDIPFTKHIAWRFAQIDYLMTTFSGAALNANARQNSLRLATGVVFRFGIPNPPPPPNQPPVAACSASPTSVYTGSSDVVTVHVNASDPDAGDTLTYSYTATGGTVDGTGPDARWTPTGLAAGTYTVNAKVDDGHGMTATCASDIAVAPKPNQPPTISCSTDRSPIMPGERTGITATASDPDNDPLTYTYSTTGGTVSGDGPKAQFDSTGLQPGSYTVKCSVSDGKGGTADANTNVDVQQPAPPPQATKVGDCGYTKAGASRFDNLCKRVGDDVALRLKNDPNAKVVIVGYADSREPKATKLAQARADLAKKYLGEKGIDASRISTRTGTASKEKGTEKSNRRVDFIFVPDGATYTDSGM